MERRTALALAMAAASTITAASAAFAVNVGLLQHDTNRSGGVLDVSLLDASYQTGTTDPTEADAGTSDPSNLSTPAPGSTSPDDERLDNDSADDATRPDSVDKSDDTAEQGAEARAEGDHLDDDD